MERERERKRVGLAVAVVVFSFVLPAILLACVYARLYICVGALSILGRKLLSNIVYLFECCMLI